MGSSVLNKRNDCFVNVDILFASSNVDITYCSQLFQTHTQKARLYSSEAAPEVPSTHTFRSSSGL